MRSQTWKNNNIKHLEFGSARTVLCKNCSLRKSPYVETHDTVNMRLQSYLMEPIIIYSVRVQCTKRNIAAGDDEDDDDNNKTTHTHIQIYTLEKSLIWLYHNDNNSVMFFLFFVFDVKM